MIHKNCEGSIVEIEYACAVQLHHKIWQFFDSLDDIEEFPEFPQDYKLVDSFPHLSQGYFTLTTMMKKVGTVLEKN